MSSMRTGFAAVSIPGMDGSSLWINHCLLGIGAMKNKIVEVALTLFTVEFPYKVRGLEYMF